MKDSGVEWIGEIPEDWEIVKFKHLGKITQGYAFKSNDFVESGIKSIKITNVQSFDFNWEESFYLPEDFSIIYKDFLVFKGDLVFALTRPIISTGIKVAIFNENSPALANQRTGIFKINNEDIDLNFLYFVVYSKPFFNDFSIKITETNQPNVFPKDIEEIKIILPELQEQKFISNYLIKKIENTKKIISKTNEQIKLLEEYKKSLINHVITGKLNIS